MHIKNKDAYIKAELNKINFNVQMMIFVWTLTRVVVRTNTLDGEQTTSDLESSITGLSLPDYYKEISRSKDIIVDNSFIFYLLMLPVLGQMIQIESLFIWRLIIYVLSDLVENN